MTINGGYIHPDGLKGDVPLPFPLPSLTPVTDRLANFESWYFDGVLTRRVSSVSFGGVRKLAAADLWAIFRISPIKRNEMHPQTVCVYSVWKTDSGYCLTMQCKFTYLFVAPIWHDVWDGFCSIVFFSNIENTNHVFGWTWGKTNSDPVQSSNMKYHWGSNNLCS